MRKLSEIRGEDGLDVLADILEPAAEIMTDKDIVLQYRAGERLRAITTALKNHKKAVIEILAKLDGEDIETYDPPFFMLPIKLLEVFNDPDVQMVFQSQGQKEDGKSSGSATENIEETETK